MNNFLQIPPTEGVRKVGRGEGEHFDIAGSRYTWKAKDADTGYAFAIYELTYAEDFYILEG
jgi:hypothetical protein